MKINFNLDALQNVALSTVVKPAKTKTEKLPVTGDIKVFKNGSIFYSKEFAAKVGKDGLDFVNSVDWTMYAPAIEAGAPELVFIAITSLEDPKLSAKVDVRTRKSDDTGAVAGVRKNLIPMLVELYDLNPEFKSVELQVMFDNEVPASENNIYYIPKTFTSGAKKGENDSVRRENTIFWPLVIAEADLGDIIEEELTEVEAAEVVDNPEEDSPEVVAENTAVNFEAED